MGRFHSKLPLNTVTTNEEPPGQIRLIFDGNGRSYYTATDFKEVGRNTVVLTQRLAPGIHAREPPQHERRPASSRSDHINQFPSQSRNKISLDKTTHIRTTNDVPSVYDINEGYTNNISFDDSVHNRRSVSTDVSSSGYVSGSTYSEQRMEKDATVINHTFTSAIPLEQQSLNTDQDWYKMDHEIRGYCLVFIYTELRGESREGADKDRDRIRDCFKFLNFTVVIHENCSSWSVKEIIKKYTSYNLKNTDCFAVVVSSHGDNGKIMTSDGIISIDDIEQCVIECKDLLGKPKLFFFQACRGSRADQNLVPDAITDNLNVVRCSKLSHILVSYSTAKGYFAYRNTQDGSIYIKRLTELLKKYGTTQSLLDVLTKVNKAVNEDFKDQYVTQVAGFESYLDKLLTFPTVVEQRIMFQQVMSNGKIRLRLVGEPSVQETTYC